MALYSNPYLSFATIFSSVINGMSCYDSLTRAACYGMSLSRCTKHHNVCDYHIILLKTDYLINSGFNNYCPFKKHTIENYLRRIASIKPFKYKVVEAKYQSRHPAYRIDMHIEGTKKEITFVLQCIKRTYEYPYNFYLEQAFEMQKLPAFKFDSILNLFNVAFSTFDSSKNHDHCFSGCTRFEKYATLREKLPYISLASDLYPEYVRGTDRPQDRMTGIEYNGSSYRPSNSNQWSNKVFKAYLPYYIENYNILKR